MEVKNVKLSDKLPIICTFDLTFLKMGLLLRDLRLMDTSGKRWIAFPSRKYEEGGKTKYFAYIGIETPRKDAFEKRVKELLEPFLAQKATQSPSFSEDPDLPF